MCENELFANEVYDRQTGHYELIDVQIPDDWIAYDEISQQSIVAYPIYDQSDVNDLKEKIQNRLPLGAEIYEITDVDAGVRVDFKDHMSDCHFYKFFVIDTPVDAYMLQDIAKWCKPLDYNMKHQDGFFYNGKFIDGQSLAKSNKEFATLGGDY